ncbi:hypothetical protein [Spirosoma fluminis]
MITTSIILEFDGRFPIYHQSEGFAKSEAIATWLFAFCGWSAPCELLVQVGVVEWPEGDVLYPPSDTSEFYVLNNPLRLN